MPSGVPQIDFRQLRPHGQPASQSAAFEELSSILLTSTVIDWPSGTRFDKFGNPDGGREGRAVLPNGDVWAWQAKFLFTFDSSAVSQIRKSLIRAIETEPRLTRYYVVLPIDRAAGDNSKSKSAFTLWTESVEAWEQLANEAGKAVDIRYVGAHELGDALAQSHNSGRLRYWFDRTLITLEDQAERLEEILAKVGPRYSPQMHVDLDIAQTLSAISPNGDYKLKWQTALASIRASRAGYWPSPIRGDSRYELSIQQTHQSLDLLDSELVQVIDALHDRRTASSPQDAIDSAQYVVDSLLAQLRERSETDKGYYIGDAGTLYTHAAATRRAIRTCAELTSNIAFAISNRQAAIVVGSAGTGKTHLLCDLAHQRLQSGVPTTMLLGQDFDTSSKLQEIPTLANIGNTLDEFLSVLDAAGEANDKTSALFIDAINESESASSWEAAFRALVAKADRYPNLAVVVSCRSEYLDAVVGDTDIPIATHHGFDEAVSVAVSRYASQYDLDPPTFPVLNPEFSNPLFLRLTCETLATLGSGRFVLGSVGLITLCAAFTEAVNQRLARPTRCDYDITDDLVQQTIDYLSSLDDTFFSRSSVKVFTESLLPNRPWSRSILKGMLDEGLLIEVAGNRITYGYQRVGDVARAIRIANLPLEEIESLLADRPQRDYRDAGLLAALAVCLPERHGVELCDLLHSDGVFPHSAIDAFVESLTLRSSDSVSTRTVDLATKAISTQYWKDDVLNQLIRMACVPGHRLNADFMNGYLSSQSLIERDLQWSRWLIGSCDADYVTPAARVIDWAWPQNVDVSVTCDEETARLAILVLSWFTTTTDRKVRDRASKAIVKLGCQMPQSFISVLRQTTLNDDWYRAERIAGAACAISLRIDSPSLVGDIAATLETLTNNVWPRHLLIRDYIDRVRRHAEANGWTGAVQTVSSESSWPLPATPRDEIDQLTAGPQYRYSTLWNSIHAPMGDFGRYIVESSLRNFDSPNASALQDTVERVIFCRVVSMGWTPELFDAAERGLRHGRSSNPVERFGKKYQWIAFYEVLGVLIDNVPLAPDWYGAEARIYSRAEQLIWRDIDLTVSIQPVENGADDAPWYSPSSAEYADLIFDDYPSDLAGVPKPSSLIDVEDADGIHWLSLLSSPHWKQRFAPEVAALEPPYRDTWMQIHAYIVPVADVQALKEWAASKDWYGRWMPEIADLANVLLGAFPTGVEWDDASGDIEDWNGHRGGEQPTIFYQAAAGYSGTGTDRDLSTTTESLGYLPSRKLFELLELQRGVDFMWAKGDDLVVMDASSRGGQPSTLLMRRDQIRALEEQGLTLFWTVLIGHEHNNGDHLPPDDDYKWITASASYIYEEGDVRLIGSQAAQFKTGPDKIRDVSWEP
ncbi:NACHT domain-containing protein [Clavibacter capsici]|uniref:hypothetical protein n=1 Tax=Clavibacter capsici TaxID=1874630 RepID=UPI00293E15C3|nr:hypothetical protein [Clavibacter capsici]